MASRYDTFRSRHHGKYVVMQAGILVMRPFDTEDQAKEWATNNYRDPKNWRVVRL